MSISVVRDALQCVLTWLLARVCLCLSLLFGTHCSASFCRPGGTVARPYPGLLVEGRVAFLAFASLELLHHVNQHLHAFDGQRVVHAGAVAAYRAVTGDAADARFFPEFVELRGH